MFPLQFPSMFPFLIYSQSLILLLAIHSRHTQHKGQQDIGSTINKEKGLKPFYDIRSLPILLNQPLDLMVDLLPVPTLEKEILRVQSMTPCAVLLGFFALHCLSFSRESTGE